MAVRILVGLDGTLADPDTPFLHADDLAAVRGDGIFETLLVAHGVACAVDAHLDRLARSAAMLDLPSPDRRRWRAAIEVAAAEWVRRAGAEAEALLRLVYSRGRESAPEAGPTGYVTVGPVGPKAYQARERGVSVLTLDRGFDSQLAARAPWQLMGAKTLSYATNMAALRHAESRGCDDAIYLSSDGRVLEGPRSTVITVTGRRLVTPPAEIGILPGTTAAATYALAAERGWETVVENVTPADLFDADAVWLVSSVTLAARVTSIDGRVLRKDENLPDFAELVRSAVCSG